MLSGEQRARIIKRGHANVDHVRHWKRSQEKATTHNRLIMSPQPLEDDYADLFKARTEFPSEAALEQFCEHFGQVFCPNCTETLIPHSSNAAPGLSVRRLFVTVGPDPLGNERDQAWCVCHGCGFEEYHAIERPKPESDHTFHQGSSMYAQQLALAQSQAAKMQQQAAMQQAGLPWGLSVMGGGGGAGNALGSGLGNNVLGGHTNQAAPKTATEMSLYEAAKKYLRIP